MIPLRLFDYQGALTVRYYRRSAPFIDADYLLLTRKRHGVNYVSLNKIIYDADKEIAKFAREVLPKGKEIEILMREIGGCVAQGYRYARPREV